MVHYVCELHGVSVCVCMCVCVCVCVVHSVCMSACFSVNVCRLVSIQVGIAHVSALDRTAQERWLVFLWSGRADMQVTPG